MKATHALAITRENYMRASLFTGAHHRYASPARRRSAVNENCMLLCQLVPIATFMPMYDMIITDMHISFYFSYVLGATAKTVLLLFYKVIVTTTNVVLTNYN